MAKKRPHRVTVRMSDKVYRRIGEAATAGGVSMSQWLAEAGLARAILEGALREQGPDLDIEAFRVATAATVAELREH